MMKTDRLLLLFSHIDEPIPAEFLDYAKPTIKAGQVLNLRQIQKWKSRRMAYFLLHQIFEKYQLDCNLLTQIKKTESGRPYLLHSNIDFNISHSGNYVAVLFSFCAKKKVVGIDIEQPQKIRDYQKLLNHYAKAPEISEILSGEHLPQLPTLADRFYLSWCLREAVLKSQGVGLVQLSSVQHSVSERIIQTPYCPQGKLFFSHQLPFYLAYFVAQTHSMLLSPDIYEWKNSQLMPISEYKPIIYQVN